MNVSQLNGTIVRKEEDRELTRQVVTCAGSAIFSHMMHWEFRRMNPGFKIPSQFQTKVFIAGEVGEYLDAAVCRIDPNFARAKDKNVDPLDELIDVFLMISTYFGEDGLNDAELASWLRNVLQGSTPESWSPEAVYELFIEEEHFDYYEGILYMLFAMIATWPGLDLKSRVERTLTKWAGRPQ